MHRNLEEAARAVGFLAEALDLAPSQRLLDLCCGTGRHLVFLGAKVGQAVGLDLSRVLLSRARQHWRASAQPAGAGPKAALNDFRPLLLQGDMRHLPLGSGAFDRVVNLFTSFGYFEQEADNLAVLCEVARVLKPGGLFAIDHINRESMLAGLKPETERLLPGGRRLIEKRRWDEPTRRVIKDVAATEPSGQVKAWCESVRVYEPEELEELMRAAGLEPLRRFGDYGGSPWQPTAPRLILIAQR